MFKDDGIENLVYRTELAIAERQWTIVGGSAGSGSECAIGTMNVWNPTMDSIANLSASNKV